MIKSSLLKKNISLKDKWPMVVLIFISLLSSLFYWSNEKPSTNQNVSDAVPKTDTFIPDGFVLVPISLSNANSLDALLGEFGVIDLYSGLDKKDLNSRIVARQVKILRAPLDPKEFAVLVPENKALDILNQNGPLYAVLQNPKKANTGFSQKTKKSQLVIKYE